MIKESCARQSGWDLLLKKSNTSTWEEMAAIQQAILCRQPTAFNQWCECPARDKRLHAVSESKAEPIILKLKQLTLGKTFDVIMCWTCCIASTTAIHEVTTALLSQWVLTCADIWLCSTGQNINPSVQIQSLKLLFAMTSLHIRCCQLNTCATTKIKTMRPSFASSTIHFCRCNPAILV